MNTKLLKKARKKITIRGRRNYFEVEDETDKTILRINFTERDKAISSYCHLIIYFAKSIYRPKQNIHK